MVKTTMSKFENRVTQGVRAAVNPITLSLRNRSFDKRETIVVVGHYRSGTTWLAELISKSLNAAIVFEPIQIDNVPRAKKAGFDYDNFRMPTENWPEGKAYLDQVLSGKRLNSWSVSHIPILRAVTASRLTVKLVAANQMLGWLISEFDIPPPALIIRHPCAILSSWINRGWRLNNWITPPKGLYDHYPQLETIISSLRYEEEFFAAKWCIDHFVPFSQIQADSAVVVPFEKLVTDGAEFLDQILGRWNAVLPQQVADELHVPSAKASDAIRDNYLNVLNGWTKSLSSKQIERVLVVVKRFGLDFYSKEIEPDYSRILQLDNGTLRS